MGPLLPLQTVSVCLILGFAIIQQATTVNGIENLITSVGKDKHTELGCKFVDENYRPIPGEDHNIISGDKPAVNQMFAEQDVKSNEANIPLEKEKHAELGCSFEDENYRTIPGKDHIWGDKPAVSRMFAKQDGKRFNITEWEEFTNSVQNSLIKTVNFSSINNIDPFLRFVRNYQTEREERKKALPTVYVDSLDELKKFYSSYVVPLRYDSPAGFLINAFNEMAKANQMNQANKPYLVAAYVEPYINIDLLRNGYPILKSKRLQEHMAGVIKFSLGNYRKRIGYLLIDPGYINDVVLFPFAVVLMEDEQYPHEEIIWGNKRLMKNVKFTMGSPNDMWVLATYGSYDTYPQLSAVKHVVYYLGQAYCSFLESTTKPLLLRPHKGIITFNEYVSAAGYSSFKVQKQTKGFRVGRFIYDRAHENRKRDNFKFTDILPKNVGFPQLQEYCRRTYYSKETVQKKMDKYPVLKLDKFVTMMQFAYEIFCDPRFQAFYDLWEHIARENIGWEWDRDLRQDKDDDDYDDYDPYYFNTVMKMGGMRGE